MTPLSGFAIATALFALVRFWLFPVSMALWKQASADRQLRTAPLLAVLEKFTALMLTAALVFGTFVLCIPIVKALSPSNSDLLSTSLARLTALRTFLQSVGTYWHGAFFGLAFLVLAVVAAAAMRRQVIDNVIAGLQAARAALQSTSSWPSLELTEPMRQVLRDLQEAHAQLESLQPTTPGYAEEEPRRRAEIDKLQAQYVELDLERRLNLTWQDQARLRGGARLLSSATAMLLCVLLIGFSLPAAIDWVEARRVALEDLRLTLAKAEADRNLQRVRSTRPQESMRKPATPAQRLALERLAADYRESFVRAWLASSRPTDNQTVERAARVRLVIRDIAAWEAAHTHTNEPYTPSTAASLTDDRRQGLADAFVKDAEQQGLATEPRVEALGRAVADGRHQPTFVSFPDVRDFDVERVLETLLERGAGETLTRKIVDIFRTGMARYLEVYLQSGRPEEARAAASALLMSIITPELRDRVLTLTRQRTPPPTPRDDSSFSQPEDPTVIKVRDRLLALSKELSAEYGTKLAQPLSHYDELRVYGGTGGILLGASPATHDALTADDLTWARASDGYRLTVGSQRGRPVTVVLGPFSADLVHQALAFAADGRRTVVTMIAVPQFGRQQVMLHPAFRDTALGARLIANDHWIFDYTDPDPPHTASPVRRTLTDVGTAMALYAAVVQWFRDPITHEVEPRLSPEQQARAVAGVRALAPQASRLGLFPPVLEKISTCAGQDLWIECVGRAADRGGWRNQLPLTLPLYDFVSQIYERAPATDTLQAFLESPAQDPLWPLALTVQMTVGNKAAWEFPQFESYGPPIVLAGLTRDKKLGDLQELRQLGVLQRLFRAGLSGSLGAEFPVERLAQLMAETSRSHSRPCPTPRWMAPRSADARSMQLARDTWSVWRRYGERRPKPPAAQAPPALDHCVALLHTDRPTTGVGCDWSAWRHQFGATCAAHHPDDPDASSTDDSDCLLRTVATLGAATEHLGEIRDQLGATHAPQHSDALACLP